VVNVMVILKGSDSCGDVGFGKEMTKFCDVFADEFWTARSDVSELRASEWWKISIEESEEFEIDLYSAMVRVKTVVERFRSAVCGVRGELFGHKNIVKTFCASGICCNFGVKVMSLSEDVYQAKAGCDL
jgi:hypothetical protein